MVAKGKKCLIFDGVDPDCKVRWAIWGCKKWRDYLLITVSEAHENSADLQAKITRNNYAKIIQKERIAMSADFSMCNQTPRLESEAEARGVWDP